MTVFSLIFHSVVISTHLSLTRRWPVFQDKLDKLAPRDDRMAVESAESYAQYLHRVCQKITVYNEVT